MKNDLPLEHQVIDVRMDSDDWQPATFVNGEFVDVYGLPLDQQKISSWRISRGGLPEPAPKHGGWVRP